MSLLLSADKLPLEVIQELLSFIPDATTLCRLASTCNTFSRIINDESGDVWECLFCQRWKTNIPTASSFRVAYQRRHELDQRALQKLQELSGSIQRQQQPWTNILRREYEFENWRLLQQSRKLGSNIYDLFRALASNNKYPTIENQEIDDLTRCLAAHRVQEIHFSELLKDWYTLLNSEKTDAAILEEGALLLSKSILDLDDLLAETDGIDGAVQQLDQIGNEFQHRLDVEGVSLENPEQAIRILNTILIDEMGIQGISDNDTEDNNHVTNSSIMHLMKKRKGTPMTVAVLYKCICDRVGMQINVIGLPGPVVLGIPLNDGVPLFVDVFGGHFLSLEECQTIAASNLRAWQPELLWPLPAKDVLIRMIHTIIHSFCTGRNGSRAERMVTLLLVAEGQGLHNSDHYVASYPEQAPSLLDPRLFRKYNLISDEMLNSLERNDH